MKIILLALLYFLGGELTLWLFFNDKIVTIGLFIPEGIALAAALAFGPSMAIGVFFGQFLLALLNHIDPLTSLFIALINATEAFIAPYLAKRLNFHSSFDSLEDLAKFALLIALLQLFSATFGNIALFLGGYIRFFSFSFASWWIGNALSQLIFTPALLGLLKQRSIHPTAIAFALYSFIIAHFIPNALLLLLFTLPLTIAIAVYYGTFRASLAVALMSVGLSYVFTHTTRLSPNETLLDVTINFNIFLLLHALSAIFIGLLFENRRLQEHLLNQKIQKEIEKNQTQEEMLLAKERLAKMGEALTMIAHQWRQPLNTIGVSISFLQFKLQQNRCDSAECEPILQKISNQLHYLNTTIDDFQEFLTPNKAKQETNFPAIVYKALFLLKERLKNDIQMSVQVKEVRKFQSYENELVQVVINIIQNAYEAFLKNRTPNPHIKIEIDGLKLHIEDNAGGIDPKVIDKLFDPYFSTKDGLGFGLYMSKIIIEERLNGILEAHNTSNGARFSIILKDRE